MVGPKYQKPPAMTQAPPAAYKESPGAARAGGKGRRATRRKPTRLRPERLRPEQRGLQAADAGEWKVASRRTRC